MLILTDATWKQMLAMLATSPAGVERIAYLDGIRAAAGAGRDIGIVTTVTVPHAVQSAGHFTVCAQEMSRAGAHLRQHGLVRLAQVHTHPGHDTRHSVIDDERAYSRKASAVSIVLPWHAADTPSPTDGAVYVHENLGWRRLSQVDAEAFIRIIPATVDTRRTRLNAAVHQPDQSSSRGWRRWQSWSKIWAHVMRPR